MNSLPPLQPPRPGAGEHIDWDKPVGYAHALNLITQNRNLSMAAPQSKKAEDLELNDVIIDPEGNEAHVIRYRWLDHKRGRLSTDLGEKVVNHADRFPLA